METGPGRGTLLLAAAAAGLVAGVGIGWVVGLHTSPPPTPPPPPFLVNPLGNAHRGETLVLKRKDGMRTEYVVLEEAADSVLLGVNSGMPGAAMTQHQLRVTRNFLGVFHCLEGSREPAEVEAAARDLVVERITPETVVVGGRSFDAWRVDGTHRALGKMKMWITEALPVHGVLALESERGARYEMESYSPGR